MSVAFDEVTIEHIGVKRGEPTLVEDVNAALSKLAHAVQDDQCNGKASITIKIDIERAGEGAVVIGGDVSIKTPKKKRRALTAMTTDDGGLVTQQTREQRLPGVDNVRPIAAK